MTEEPQAEAALADKPVEDRGFAPLHHLGRGALYLVESRVALLLVLNVGLIFLMYLDVGSEFLSIANMSAIAIDAATYGVLTIGMMLLMISGVFDLSIGGILTLAGIVSAMAANAGFGIVPAWLVGVGVGIGCGIFNGLIVTRLRLNALIVTLATTGIFLGVSQLLSGTGVTQINGNYQWLGETVIAGFQLPVWICLGLVVVFTFLTHRNPWFRYLYFIGGNERAARLSGINTARVRFVAFILMGALAGLAGVLTASRLDAAVISAGDNVPLNVITAAVLGGAALTGGAGSIPGAALAIFFITLIQAAMIVANVGIFWQQIVVGVVLLLAISTEFIQNRRGA